MPDRSPHALEISARRHNTTISRIRKFIDTISFPLRRNYVDFLLRWLLFSQTGGNDLRKIEGTADLRTVVVTLFQPALTPSSTPEDRSRVEANRADLKRGLRGGTSYYFGDTGMDQGTQFK